MEQVNVVVTAAVRGEKTIIYPGCFPKVSGIDSCIRVTDASELLAQEQKGDFHSRPEFDAILNTADILFAMRLPRNILKRAPNIKWIQTMAAGVDMVLDDDLVYSPVILTNVSGIHATTISEYIIAIMLMFSRKMSLYEAQKQEKKWVRHTPSLLYGQTAGVIGLGHIGREVARLCRSFGMNVIATRRSAVEGQRARYVDKLIPRNKLAELLAESDFVLLTLPYTKETSRLIGEKEFNLMKSTAVIINIGRGDIINEEDLILALEKKRIAGAGLDVFTKEPLPIESKIWNLPNVILTPHVAGAMPDYSMHTTQVFCENLQRFLAGKKLRHVVNKKRGY